MLQHPVRAALLRGIRSNTGVFVLYLLIALPFFLLQDRSILHSDDWFFLQSMVTGTMHGLDPGRGRFLFPSFWSLMHWLFGANLSGPYLLLWFMQVVFASAVHQAIRKLHPEHADYAFIAGLLVLLAPGNHTREWWTMGHPWLSFGVCFAFALVGLADYVRNEKRSSLIASGVLLLMSFALYELHLGLTFVILGLTGWVVYRRSGRVPLGIITTGLLLTAFYGLRYVMYFSSASGGPKYGQGPHLTFTMFVERMTKFFFLVPKMWSAPLYARLPVSFPVASILTALICASSFGIGVIIVRMLPERQTDGSNVRARDIAFLMKAALFSFVCMIVSLFPILLVVPPSGFDIHSRTLMAASPAAALLLGSLVLLASTHTARSHREALIIAAFGLAPLIVLSVVERTDRLHAHARAWETQRHVWTSMLKAVPQLADSTHVVVLVDKDEADRTPGFRCVCGAPFDCISGAVQLLYDNPTLGAEAMSTAMFDGRSTLDSTRTLLARPWGTPIRRAIGVAFDAAAGSIHVVSRQELERRWNCSLPLYDPFARIDTLRPRSARWHWLVN